eukprot:maker-scaffold_48-snap-gene-0.36-mRNA-1 protein AED:0.20 eAED:0.20 QI:76/0.66/0.71/1/0.83/0.71/7/98/196
MINNEDVYKVKIILIGDRYIGKVCFVLTTFLEVFHDENYQKNSKWKYYYPTHHDYVHRIYCLNGFRVGLDLWDSTVPEGFQELRALSILLSFSLDNIETLFSVDKFWIPEIMNNFNEETMPKFILLGMKYDLASDENERDKIMIEAMNLKRKYKIAAYMSCSSFQNVGITEAVRKALVLGFQNRYSKSKKSCCIIL